MPNALDALRTGSQPAETPASPQTTGSSNPLDALRHGGTAPAPENPVQHALGAVGHAAGQVATGVGNLLDAQRYGVAKLLTGKSDTGDQRTAERKAVGTQGIYDAIGHIPVVGHALQGASDVVQDTLTDPLTYETLGAGPILKATGLAAKAAPAVTKGFEAVRDTPLGATLYDFTHWGGKVEREQGADVVDRLRGVANNASSTGARVQQHLVRRFGEATAGLADEDKIKVGQALNGEIAHDIPGELTPKQQSVYRQLRTLTELDYKMRADTARTIAFNAGTKGMSDADKSVLQRMFAQNKPIEIPEPGKRSAVPNPGDTVKQRSRERNINVPGGEGEAFTLDENGQKVFEQHPAIADLPAIRPSYKLPLNNQAAIDRAKMLNQKFQDINFAVEQGVPKRADYMPWAHEYDETGKLAGREASEMSASEYHDPRTKTREDLKVTSPDLRSGFEAMAKNTGKQVQTGVINKTLGDLLDHPDIDKLFKQTIRATGDYRTNPQKIKDAWMKVVGYPRAATVSLTPRHGMNIMDLAANTVPPERLPGYMKDVADLTRKLMTAKNEKEYAALTQEGRDLGALGGNFTERQAFFQKIPDFVPGIGGKSTGPLGAYTRLNNKLVWAIDEAAKQTYAKMLVETGEAKGLEAGGMASKRLVDYEHKSPMVEALKYVAPFGTFRGSVPGAVLGGVARNPARAALLNRATGGTMYGGKPGKGQSGVTAYNPTADVARGIDAPQDFLRGTIAQPIQAAGTIAEEALTGNPGASLEATKNELQDAPGQIMRGQFGQLFTPRKISPYAKAVTLRAARYLNYGHAIDARWLVNAALAGVPEARDVSEQLGLGQFQQQQATPLPERLGKAALQQVGGVSVR